MPEGARIADYLLFEKLSRTAYGDSYRAGQLLGNVVERHVLLQFFNGPGIDIEAFWQLVSDRSRLLKTVNDPHLGSCVDFDRHAGQPLAAYVFRPSKSLKQFFGAIRAQRLPVSLEQALFIIERVALALTAAHEVQHRGRPVLHGFLVPDLIRLTGDGQIEVIGLEAAPGLRNQLAAHPAFVSHLAPQARAGEPPTGADDVYSLGAILFQLLTGDPLPAQSGAELDAAIADSRLAAGGETLPPVIASLLKGSLAPPAERIPDSATWQQVISRIILEGEHNPSTFNLSFLMHTVFREELEEETAAVSKELGLHVSAQPVVTAVHDASAETEVGPPPNLGAPRSLAMSFLTGFAVSFVGAALLIAIYFLFLRSPSEAASWRAVADTVFRSTADATLTPEAPSNLSIDEPAATANDTVPRSSRDEIGTGDLLADGDSPTASAEGPASDSSEAEAPGTEVLKADIRAADEERLENIEPEPALSRGGEPIAEVTEAKADSSPNPVSTTLADTTKDASIQGGRDPRPEPDSNLPASPALTSIQEPKDDRVSSEESPRISPELANSATSVVEDPGSGGDAATQLTEVKTASALVQNAKASLESPTVEPGNLRPPVLENYPRPIYPAAARRLRKAATVKVRVLVDASGRATEAELSGPRAGFGFDAAALRAARASRWQPATRNDVPLEAWAHLTVDFKP